MNNFRFTKCFMAHNVLSNTLFQLYYSFYEGQQLRYIMSPLSRWVSQRPKVHLTVSALIMRAKSQICPQDHLWEQLQEQGSERPFLASIVSQKDSENLLKAAAQMVMVYYSESRNRWGSATGWGAWGGVQRGPTPGASSCLSQKSCEQCSFVLETTYDIHTVMPMKAAPRWPEFYWDLVT